MSAPAMRDACEVVNSMGEPLEWQRELDVAIADIDSRLTHPRRRATDVSRRCRTSASSKSPRK